MDILRHGADVEVLAPNTLRDAVIEALDAARKRYVASAPDADSATRDSPMRSRAKEGDAAR